MSVISGRSKPSTISSILKKTPTIQSKLATERRNSKVQFTLPYAKKVRHILQNFAKNENVKEYENLVCLIRDSEISDSDIRSLLVEATECISLLNKHLRLFVEAILRLKWTHCCKEVVTEYHSFLLNLLSAHNYHAKFVIDSLVVNFLPDVQDKDWEDGVPRESDCEKCANVHCVINMLLKIVPMSYELLMQSFIFNYPYFTKPTHMHELYLHNLLWILDYQPRFRRDVLRLILSKLILLDVNAPREEIENAEYYEETDEGMFPFDDETSAERMKHPLAHTMDVCLDKIFNYMILECHDIESGMLDWEKTKSLYQDVLKVFDEVLLPTYNIHHVQFVMFNLCSYKSTIAEAFLNYLWNKVCTPTVPSIHRQTAVAYISSLIARGSFIPLNISKGTLQQMAEWIHTYIATQDGLECVNSDVRVHTVFYSVCQALFYVVAFKHRDLVNTKKNIVFLQSLNMAKMVTCRLNPLRVCQSAVLQNFAAVTRMYQLAYCYSVIEHNSRNVMPTIYQDDKGTVVVSDNTMELYFPFDPYLLKRSGKKIVPFYVEYQEENEDNLDVRECEMDDFLSSDSSGSKSSNRFSYGTSPGFKHKSN